MSEPDEEQELLDTALAAMSDKLLENSDKRSWRYDTVSALFERLVEEVAELRVVVEGHEVVERTHARKLDKVDWELMRNEAADVANFAAMIIDSCYDSGKLTRPSPSRWLERIRMLEWRQRRAMTALRGYADNKREDHDD